MRHISRRHIIKNIENLLIKRSPKAHRKQDILPLLANWMLQAWVQQQRERMKQRNEILDAEITDRLFNSRQGRWINNFMYVDWKVLHTTWSD